METIINKLNWYTTKDQAFENGTGDNFFKVDGFWTCISENDTRFSEMKKAGYKTEIEIYLEKVRG